MNRDLLILGAAAVGLYLIGSGVSKELKKVAPALVDPVGTPGVFSSIVAGNDAAAIAAIADVKKKALNAPLLDVANWFIPVKTIGGWVL